MGLSPAKIILGSALVLFTVIGSVALFKKGEKTEEAVVQEIVLDSPIASVEIQPEVVPVQPEKKEVKQEPLSLEISDANLIDRLFTLDSSKLPIVETVSYTSRVPWLKGRPAWIADYATFYATSRHFIARSLNHKPDYFTQKVSPGDKFNVLKKDKDIQFYLVIDLSLCKMWFYYYDVGAAERVLLKTYNVGLGRKDSAKASGFLTPTGKYELGSRIAVYKPGIMGYLQEKKIEMMRVF
ncbi:MAG TPA: L,D-transpeptidase, partial [Chlamydiales bacterium]|nr:L,D-transpeptidase [Chlamydiales bacterium]